MTRLLPSFGRLALALAALGMLAPGSALAQIASPANAGGNAGNNTSGSSASPISTPSFAPAGPTSSVAGVSVSNASSITASPAQTTAMQSAASTAAAQQSGDLQQVVAGGSPAQVVVGPDAQAPNISLDLGGGATTTSIAGLPAALGGIGTLTSQSFGEGSGTLIAGLPGALIGLGSQRSLTLTSAVTGVTTTITNTGPGGIVTLTLSTGPSMQIATTPETTVPVMQFAAMASVVGLTPNSIQLGLQMLPLVIQASPTPVQGAVTVMQLLAGVQGLTAQTNLANLAQSINTFNALVSSAPPEVLVALSGNASFTGLAAVMRAAQAGIAAGA